MTHKDEIRSADVKKMYDAMDREPVQDDAPPTCALCGKPMPAGEEMFKYHGYSGPCPTES